MAESGHVCYRKFLDGRCTKEGYLVFCDLAKVYAFYASKYHKASDTGTNILNPLIEHPEDITEISLRALGLAIFLGMTREDVPNLTGLYGELYSVAGSGKFLLYKDQS